MIWQVQLDPAMCAASVHARLPRRLGRRTPLSNPQHRLHPAKQRKVMGLLQSLAEATAIMSGELRDTEPTPIHSFIVPCRASVARLLATSSTRLWSFRKEPVRWRCPGKWSSWLAWPSWLISLLRHFAPVFSARVGRYTPGLLAGAMPAPGPRTVTSCLRL